MCEVEKNKVQKLLWVGFSILLCCLAAWWDGERDIEQQAQARQSVAQGAVYPVQAAEVTVCISGAVSKPGLYQVPKGCRAQEVIELAGGVTEEADMDRVNLAKICKEGTHIRVPRLSAARWKRLQATKSEASQTENLNENRRPLLQKEDGRRRQEGETERAGVIRLNEASEEELTCLPGIGPATARRIVAYRKQFGFRCVEDLLNVSGIGPAKLEQIRNRVTL